jgi:tetratricopeptide (TPR) repeat protein
MMTNQMTTSFWKKMALVLLGLILSLVLLELGMRLGGFVLLSIQEYGNLQSIKQKGAYRILCLGESTTQGEYPKPLEKILNQRNIGMRFSVIDEGRGGTNTPAIVSRVGSYLAEYRPDMVVAMMGINDGGSHMPLEAPTTSGGRLFIRSFRVYKLMRLLWLHLLTKAKEMEFCKPAFAQPISAKDETPHPKTEQKETSAGVISAKGPFKKVIKPESENDHRPVALGQLHQKQDEISSVEDSLKKAIELDPKNDIPYTELGFFYKEEGELAGAGDAFKKAIELNPKSDNAYVGLGWLYRAQDKSFQAEDAFKKATELNPKNEDAYFGLGALWPVLKNFPQAKDSFKKVLELNPKNDAAYVELGGLYRYQREFPQAEYFLKKALKMNAGNDKAYVELGKLYQDQGEFSKGEDSFKKGAEHDSKNGDAFRELGMSYQERGKLQEADALFKKAIAIIPHDERLLRAMTSLYEEMGKPELAKEYVQKMAELRLGCYSAVTINSYRKLKEILDRKGIKLVCMQYPMRDVEQLKRIFGEGGGVIFVDNERVFKEAIKRSGYKEYFRDMFGGDFGHCTPKGNELLARNIAGVILREVFHK